MQLCEVKCTRSIKNKIQKQVNKKAWSHGQVLAAGRIKLILHGLIYNIIQKTNAPLVGQSLSH